jgi:hypothetical protein
MSAAVIKLAVQQPSQPKTEPLTQQVAGYAGLGLDHIEVACALELPECTVRAIINNKGLDIKLGSTHDKHNYSPRGE